MSLPDFFGKSPCRNAEKLDERWKDGQCQRGKYHNRSVKPCKTGNKVFRLRLLFRSLLHKFQNLRYRGIFKAFGGFYSKKTFTVNTAGNNIFSGKNGARYRLSGKRRSVNHAFSTPHNPVYRYLFSCFNEKNISDFHLVRIDGFHTAVRSLYIGVFRNNVHQLFNGGTALSHGIALEKFPDLIKNHNCNRFRKFSGKKGSDCRNSHQQGFIKGATIFNSQNTFP